MLKSVYIWKRKRNRVVISVQEMIPAGMQNLHLVQILQSCVCTRVRPTVHCLRLFPCPTDRASSASVPYVTVTHGVRYPCPEDMHVADCHRQRCDIGDFGSILCNLATYSIKLEILTLQTRKPQMQIHSPQTLVQLIGTDDSASKFWVGELWEVKIWVT